MGISWWIMVMLSLLSALSVFVLPLLFHSPRYLPLPSVYLYVYVDVDVCVSICMHAYMGVSVCPSSSL